NVLGLISWLIRVFVDVIILHIGSSRNQCMYIEITGYLNTFHKLHQSFKNTISPYTVGVAKI
ncbi:hypothetical protein, partial [Brucella melitensis]|uniref:hypothetical protein n=1 Tax=Brucella melitensis TaxID=29459 RepID=UPI003B67A6D9